MDCKREPARARGIVVGRLLCRYIDRPLRLQIRPPELSDPVATLQNRSGVQSAQSTVSKVASWSTASRWEAVGGVARRRRPLSTLNRRRVMLFGMPTATKRLWAHTVSYRTPPTHHLHTSLDKIPTRIVRYLQTQKKADENLAGAVFKGKFVSSPLPK